MKKILLKAVVMALLIGTIALFGVVSYADATVPSDVTESTTLTVPEGKNYLFYAQTRTNRLDSSKKDLRLICVAKQAWLEETGVFGVKFTFTDGQTPVTTKVMGVRNVFQSITAYGKNGMVENYTAADGVLIFGWVITNIPEAYANVETNIPTVDVVTGEGVIPDIADDADYRTPVQVKDDINVVTDGILNHVVIGGGDLPEYGIKVGGMDYEDSRATYILTGNYEGVYALTYYYTSYQLRWVGITVNGVQQMIQVTDTTSFWNFDSPDHTRDHAKSVTIYVEMKKGANVITFANCNGYAPNLVDFDLERVGDVLNAKPVLDTKMPTDANDLGNWTLFGDVVLEDTTTGEKRLGYLNADNTATYTVDGITAGKYLVSVEYLSMDDPNSGYKRALLVTANGSQRIALPCQKTDSWDNPGHVATAEVIVSLEDGVNTITLSGVRNYGAANAPCVYKLTLTPIAK